MARKCPTHPTHDADDCPVCERKIEAEAERAYERDDHQWQIEQDRYERHIGRS